MVEKLFGVLVEGFSFHQHPKLRPGENQKFAAGICLQSGNI